MNYQVDAIYDNGMLKPLVPLALPDQSRVTLTINTLAAPEGNAKIVAQKAALRDLWGEIDKLPQAPNSDGWSSREHDELLYGSQR